MRKIFSKIHLWLSIPFGVIIALTCFSGAMLVFEKEITEKINRDFYYVEQVATTPLPMDELVKKVSQTLPDSVRVTGVTLFADPNLAYQVNLSQPRRASIYIDQYNGEIKGRYERLPFFRTMFLLHRWLLDSMKPGGGIFWGKMIVGVSTLMFVIVLISGLVIWWPRTIKGLKNRLKITTNKGGHRFWFDLHVVGGFYALLLLLVMALTGLTWSFEWYNKAFYTVFGANTSTVSKGAPQPSSGRPNEAGRGEKPRTNVVSWQIACEEIQRMRPDYKSITVSNGTANVTVDGWGNQRSSDSYSFSPKDGKITKVDNYAERPISSKLRGWIYSVHVGSFAGLFTRILWFIAALIGAILPITGYYLWIRKTVKKRNRTK